VHDREDAAPELLAPRQYVPKDGRLHVSGGRPNEALRPLDLAPEPGRPARTVLDEAVVAADLERLASEQEEDGGWSVDFESYSPGPRHWSGAATRRCARSRSSAAMRRGSSAFGQEAGVRLVTDDTRLEGRPTDS
jgi:hypothetical protein